MKIGVFKTIRESDELTIPELVRKVLNDDDYFLDYTDKEMFSEFCDYALGMAIDEDLAEAELQEHKEEILQLLINERDRINQLNFDQHVEDLADFIETSYVEDFVDNCDVPIFGRAAKAKAFCNAIATLFNKYCGPELDAPYETVE